MTTASAANRSVLSLAVTVLVALVCVYAGVEATSFREVSSWFPTLVAAIGITSSAIIIVREVVTLARYGRDRRHEAKSPVSAPAPAPADEADADTFDMRTILSFGYWMGWLLLLAGLLVVVGGAWAATIWLIPCLRFGSRTSWRFAVIGGAVMGSLLYLLATYLGFYLPRGMLGFNS